MVTYIENGDIFKVNNLRNYAHGCNCVGAMGKGIALQFKKMFPHMYREYKKLCDSGDYKLGDIFVYEYGNGYIFNLATQSTWKTKADLEAIKSSFVKMLEFAKNESIKNITLPKIGAGLGGLNWDKVKQVIEEVASKFPEIDLYIVENYMPE